MNAYKATFVFLGIIYLVLLAWGAGIPSKGVMSLAVMGVLVCSFGWWLVDRYM